MDCAASVLEQQVMVVRWKLRLWEGPSSLDPAHAIDCAASVVEQQVMVGVTHSPESHHQLTQAPGSRRQLAGSPSHFGRWPFCCAVPGAFFWKRPSGSYGIHPMCTPTGHRACPRPTTPDWLTVSSKNEDQSSQDVLLEVPRIFELGDLLELTEFVEDGLDR